MIGSNLDLSILQMQSDFAQETGFQHEGLDLVGMAFYMYDVAIDQTDALDERALLERDRRTLHFQVFDHHHGIAIGKQVAAAVAHLGRSITGALLRCQPLEAAIGADKVCAIRIRVGQRALRAGH